ncbi:MAG: hypothetical protein ACRD43_01570, partial [Pyrinomonadaceae bacterium]
MVSNFYNKFALIILGAALLPAACSMVKKTDENSSAANTGTAANKAPDTVKTQTSNIDPDDAAARSAEANTTTGNAVARAACMTVNVGTRAVQKSQTFVVNFEPFKGSCFVTTYNPEYGDIHMDAAYDIYKGGKKIFSFPSQFNETTFGCWVDGVAFQDLDHDGLTDVIIV